MENNAKPRWVILVLTLMPVWFIASGAIGLWMYFDKEKEKNSQPSSVGAFQASEKSMADDFRKMCDVIGARNQSSAPEGLLRAAVMIEGGMGPSNAGFEVRKYQGLAAVENAQPFLHIRLAGEDDKSARRIWVLVPYDAPAHPDTPRGAVAASSLTVAMAAAQTMSQQRFDHPPNFLFMPSIYGESAEGTATLQRVQTIIGAPAAVEQIIFVGNMLHAGNLEARANERSPLRQLTSQQLKGIISQATETFPHHAKFCTQLQSQSYPIALLHSSNEDEIPMALEDQMNPPSAIFIRHAASLRNLLQCLCVEKKNK